MVLLLACCRTQPQDSTPFLFAMAETVRAKVSIGLAEALAGDEVPSEEDGIALAALAEEIERAMFAAFSGTSKDYKSKYRTLLFNLKDEKNPTLRTRVRQRELSVQTLITADAKALASEQLQAARQEMQERYFATRKQVGGELLVGWQAGTKGSLATHKNTDVNKLGSAAVAEAASGLALPLLDDDYEGLLHESAPSAEREGTPVPMEGGGTPLNDGGTPLHDAYAAEGERLLDDDIWGTRGDEDAAGEPPAKAQKLARSEAPSRLLVPPRGQPPPPGPPPPLPAPKKPAAAPLAHVSPPPPAVKAALRGTDWLLPADAEQIVADGQQLRARIERAYAVRARVCGQPVERDG